MTGTDLPMDDHHRTLFDRGTGRPILMSPVRLKRPQLNDSGDDDAAVCPFCEGHEQHTTPEVDAVRRPDSRPNAPGWRARAFPNLYPAARHHEVIAEGPAHTIHPAALDSTDLGAALTVYRRRIVALEAHDDVACAFLFKNVGSRAGSSIPHNHSQMLGLPMVPPRLASELDACNRHGCLHCAEIETAQAEDRLIHRGAHHVVLAPSTPKLPYETWLLPLDHRAEFLDAAVDADLIATLQVLFGGLQQAFGGGPFNSYLHRIPEAPFHWHFEAQPRVGQVAALELGGDMYINAVTPQHAARHWRDALGTRC
ncbi:MAG: hypothetical protein KDC87_04580 [Planctomycetes bacterium]|nr:hypothetical protein [Planctomycetota bacterium]MCB9869710.1 hypothetical protein [Planctomycetota bacterium]